MKFFLALLMALPIFAQSVVTINVAIGWCPNVVADGVIDDARALNACLAALPDNTGVVIPGRLKIAIGSTLNLTGHTSLSISGNSGKGGPVFYWIGRPGGTMMYINHDSSLLLKNLAFYPSAVCKNGTPAANIAVDVDQYGPGITTTNNVFENLRINQCQPAGNPNFIGMRFSNRSVNNVENQRLVNVSVTCMGLQGAGIDWGKSANLKQEVMDGGDISNCGDGVRIENGQITIQKMNFEMNRIAVHAFSAVDRLAIDDNDMEANNQIFVGESDVNVSTRMSGNRFAIVPNRLPPPGRAAIEFWHFPMTFMNNIFEIVPDLTVFSATAGASLVSINNVYPNANLMGWKTFDGRAISLNDRLGNASATGTGLLMSGAPPASAYAKAALVPGAGTIYWDAPTHHWLVSDDGLTLRDLAPIVSPKDPGCTYSGRQWINNATATDVLNVCLSVARKLTWVAK